MTEKWVVFLSPFLFLCDIPLIITLVVELLYILSVFAKWRKWYLSTWPMCKLNKLLYEYV